MHTKRLAVDDLRLRQTQLVTRASGTHGSKVHIVEDATACLPHQCTSVLLLAFI